MLSMKIKIYLHSDGRFGCHSLEVTCEFHIPCQVIHRTLIRNKINFQVLKPDRFYCCYVCVGKFIKRKMVNVKLSHSVVSNSIPFITSMGLQRKNYESPMPRGVTQQSFIWGGSAPRSKPLPFYIPFLTERVTLSYTFNRKWYPFHIPMVETLHPFSIPLE